MSSDWQKLANLWYRKREVYKTLWNDEPDRLHVSVVAGAPFGGPLATVRDEHVFQPVRGNLKPELQTWTCAGRPISSTPWPHVGLVSMAWSSQELLVCVFESGMVRTYSVLCELLYSFTVDERILHDGGIALSAHWLGGVALLTRKNTLFVNSSVYKSGDASYRCADLRVTRTPLTMCVLPTVRDDLGDVQVVIGTADGPVLLADRHESRELSLTDGPYVAFSVSSSGSLLACLSERGVFKVLSISDDLRVLDVANIECRRRPKQMVWCGDDCITLYLSLPTPSNGMQHVLFVGGPQNDWIPYQYDAPLHLVSECDGCRVVGAETVEFIQRVPQSTEAIFSIGNCDPPAMLCYALERYEKGDVCAQESLRLIKDDLSDAVSTCVDAAQHEHDTAVAKNLLNAATFGRHFLNDPPSTVRFVETCRNLRICAELRKAPIDIPLTVPQFEKLGMAGLVTKLTNRHQHLLACRICEWSGHPRDKVLSHWACALLRGSRAAAFTDDELCEVVLTKFQGSPGLSYAKVARVAAEVHRPNLAAKLLSHEPRSGAQIRMLLQLSRETEDDQQMLLRLASDLAAQSHDPDLLYGVLITACGGDPCRRGADIQGLVNLVKSQPPTTQPIVDLFVEALVKDNQLERFRAFCQELGRNRHAAYSAVHQVFRQRDVEERTKWLRFGKDFFGHVDAAVPEAEKSSMQFCAQACAEKGELLKVQVALDEQSISKKWRNGPHRFAGLSLVDTLSKLIEIGEGLEADNLHTKLRVSERRYWRIKVKALSASSNLSELNMMATHRTSPVGYESIVETFLKHNREDLARPFIPKLKGAELQSKFYMRMGMHEEAQAALAQRQERAGPGRLLQNMLRLS